MEINGYIDQLLEALKIADPYRVILFGSCAKGSANENSDIDILVILDNEDISKTYEDRVNKKLYINKLVRHINYKVSLDILVYSKEEYRKIKNFGNYFIEEIENTGKIIYEKAS
ncbi:MAG: nucleotidyltransferase domain-containing protein [Treponema sp.]|nr:nucleotidyltransferase domain-containing protein [Treponema sp.]